LSVQETEDSSLDTATIRSDDDNVLIGPSSEGLKSVDISGLELDLSITLRF
jgi:hypothetical protein